jgi:PAS domain S-box-containing protein
MMLHWSQLTLKTKLILLAIGIVLLSTLCSAVAAISLNVHLNLAQNVERLRVAAAAVQRHVEQVAAELDRNYLALAADPLFHDAILPVVTGANCTLQMLPAVRQLGPELQLERFAFYGPLTQPQPAVLQFYYDRALGGVVLVKDHKHLLCPVAGSVEREISNLRLFPETPDMVPPCALVVDRGQLHWQKRYEFRRAANTTTGGDKVQLGEVIGIFVLQAPALKFGLESLGEETGVNFAVFDASGRQIFGRSAPEAALAACRDASTIATLQSATGEAFDVLGQSIEHEGRLAGFVLATISHTQTARQNWNMVALLLAIASSVSLLVGSLAWRMVTRFTQPIEELTRASAEIAAGRLEGQIAVSRHDELGTLARNFDLMRSAVRAQMVEAERLTAIIEAAPNLVLTMTPDGQLTYLNDAGRRLLGWPPELAVQTKRFADLHPLDSLDRMWKQAVMQAIMNGFWQGETRLLAADGREVPVQQAIMAHYDAQGRVDYFSCIIRDLTEAKQAEEALRASEEYLAVTLDSIGDAVISTDAQGCIKRINRVAQELTGWPQFEALDRPLNELLVFRHPETRAPVESLVDQVQRDGKAIASDQPVLLIARDNTERLIATSAAPIRGEQQMAALGVVLVFRDVTRQQQVESQLLQSQKMESIGALAGGVAHDFNNMLGGITSAAELLGMELGDQAEARQYVELILRTAGRAAELTKKLLAFSRKGKVVAVPLDLHHCLGDACALLERSIDRRIKLVRELQARNTTMLGDASQLQNIFLNLGLNARDAMPDGGTLTISTRNTQLDQTYCGASPFKILPGYYIEVSVRDTGLGMKPEVQRRLFEPFFTTKPTGKGTGLGLAAVYGAVRDHNGAITVYSEPGHGAVFHVYLPVADAPPPVRSAREEIVLGFGTVLVVDDEEVIRKTVTSILTALGYQVLQAANGREGVELYRQHLGAISVVLLDMVMPELNGQECFREIRRLDPQARIIISSGFARDADITQLFDEGLAGYLQKPYRRVDLSREVGRVLNQST